MVSTFQIYNMSSNGIFNDFSIFFFNIFFISLFCIKGHKINGHPFSNPNSADTIHNQII
jgi:hypothetical protein